MFAGTLRARRVPRAAADTRDDARGSDGDTTSSPTSSPSPSVSNARVRACLSALNESTKFLVSGAAALTLALRPDLAVAWCLIGSVVNSALGKMLKKLLNEKRPEGAAKADPGMPSSHALSLAYLSTYAAFALATRGGDDGGAVFHFFGSVIGRSASSGGAAWPVRAWAVVPGCVAFMTAGGFFTWLRVELGYHTKSQVLVGYALGFVNALAWFALGESVVVPAAANDVNVKRAVYGACFATSALFAKAAVRWVDEIKRSTAG
jgi:dolichyldiphosphatase